MELSSRASSASNFALQSLEIHGIYLDTRFSQGAKVWVLRIGRDEELLGRRSFFSANVRILKTIKRTFGSQTSSLARKSCPFSLMKEK